MTIGHGAEEPFQIVGTAGVIEQHLVQFLHPAFKVREEEFEFRNSLTKLIERWLLRRGHSLLAMT